MPKPNKKLRHYLALTRKLCKKPAFTKTYLIISVVILAATTLYWALLGSRIQSGNADQLANTYLFEQGSTFGASTLPDQHTFLLKWPIFLLIKLFGSTNVAFSAATVGLVLLTVGALAYIMYRVERRPLVFGTLCLALASTLLLIPTQPYLGAVLPVNMAMTTTRNLEYIVFIAALILLARSNIRWYWRFIGASSIMALLIASDKLFLAIGVGGAVLAIIFYAIVRKWVMVKLVATWLAATIAGAALAVGTLLVVNASHITHVTSVASAGPYGLVHTAKDLLLGSIHTVLSLLTNLGANPAADTRLLGTLPDQIIASLMNVRGIGYIVNAAIATVGVIAVVHIIRLSSIRTKNEKLKHPRKLKKPRDTTADLSVMLTWSTIAACGVFAFSNHYYPVDARYVGISLFAIFIALATFTRARRFPHPEQIIVVGGIILLSIFAGLIFTGTSYTNAKSASATIDTRNGLIIDAVKHHSVDTLVGDYWRVLPVKLKSNNTVPVTPLTSCTQNRDVLSSRTWQLDLKAHSFAYLLTLDQNLTDDYPSCSLDQITKAYGSPNASIPIAGNLQQPRELLLFYDKGVNTKPLKTNPHATLSAPATVAPIAIESMPNTGCIGPTTMNIVAHEDDDLLFMNPDLLQSIKAGHCIRTVYITSGDAGGDKYYWLSREKGSESAYDSMLGLAISTVWIERIVKLPDGQFVTVANPQGNTKVSLVFMHLPDGNTTGRGFEASHHESLIRLEHGVIPVIHTTDQQSAYTSDQLAASLATLMGTYQPTEIRTQANFIDHRYPDHSDHMAVGRFVKRAHAQYIDSPAAHSASTLSFYIGYPIHGMPINVSPEAQIEKENAFFNYARYDSGACNSEEQCDRGTAYAAYLKRQYTSDF